MGRPSKLDDERLDAIRDAVRLGLSEREAAQAVGICERSWYNWKARAEAAAEILPKDWEKLRFADLVTCADELQIDVDAIPRTGHNGRLTRADLLTILRARAGRYVDFLRELKASSPEAKRQILSRIDDLVQGRVKIRRTRTTQTVRYVPGPHGGAMIPQAASEAVVTTEVLELPPDRQAAFKILEMRWPEEFGRYRTKGSEDPQEAGAAAREVHESVHRMLSTVPPPLPNSAVPEQLPEGDDG